LFVPHRPHQGTVVEPDKAIVLIPSQVVIDA
jgi:hypothetical protein